MCRLVWIFLTCRVLVWGGRLLWNVRSAFAPFFIYFFIYSFYLSFFSLPPPPPLFSPPLFSLLPPPSTPVFSFSLFSSASFVSSLRLSSAAAAPFPSSLYRREQKGRSEIESETFFLGGGGGRVGGAFCSFQDPVPFDCRVFVIYMYVCMYICMCVWHRSKVCEELQHFDAHWVQRVALLVWK